MSLFADAVQRLEDAAKILKIDSDTLEVLRHPKRIVNVSIPVRLDSGRLKVFEGYRVQYSDARGPAKGGIRFHPKVDMDEVKTLAFFFWQSNAPS